eukprot:9887939-Lingulodinium_polyedra.AAC.1
MICRSSSSLLKRPCTELRAPGRTDVFGASNTRPARSHLRATASSSRASRLTRGLGHVGGRVGQDLK